MWLEPCADSRPRSAVPGARTRTRAPTVNSIKVTASGFIHIRILCERLEYLYGVLTVTPISERGGGRRDRRIRPPRKSNGTPRWFSAIALRRGVPEISQI